jgi:hypothetical protein
VFSTAISKENLTFKIKGLQTALHVGCEEEADAIMAAP